MGSGSSMQAPVPDTSPTSTLFQNYMPSESVCRSKWLPRTIKVVEAGAKVARVVPLRRPGRNVLEEKKGKFKKIVESRISSCFLITYYVDRDGAIMPNPSPSEDPTGADPQPGISRQPSMIGKGFNLKKKDENGKSPETKGAKDAGAGAAKDKDKEEVKDKDETREKENVAKKEPRKSKGKEKGKEAGGGGGKGGRKAGGGVQITTEDLPPIGDNSDLPNGAPRGPRMQEERPSLPMTPGQALEFPPTASEILGVTGHVPSQSLSALTTPRPQPSPGAANLVGLADPSEAAAPSVLIKHSTLRERPPPSEASGAVSLHRSVSAVKLKLDSEMEDRPQRWCLFNDSTVMEGLVTILLYEPQPSRRHAAQPAVHQSGCGEADAPEKIKIEQKDIVLGGSYYYASVAPSTLEAFKASLPTGVRPQVLEAMSPRAKITEVFVALFPGATCVALLGDVRAVTVRAHMVPLTVKRSLALLGTRLTSGAQQALRAQLEAVTENSYVFTYPQLAEDPSAYAVKDGDDDRDDNNNGFTGNTNARVGFGGGNNNTSNSPGSSPTPPAEAGRGDAQRPGAAAGNSPPPLKPKQAFFSIDADEVDSLDGSCMSSSAPPPASGPRRGTIPPSSSKGVAAAAAAGAGASSGNSREHRGGPSSVGGPAISASQPSTQRMHDVQPSPRAATSDPVGKGRAGNSDSSHSDGNGYGPPGRLSQDRLLRIHERGHSNATSPITRSLDAPGTDDSMGVIEL